MLKNCYTCSNTVHNRMKLLAYTKVKRKGAVKMFQTVFKRYEKKYIIDGEQYEEVKNYLTYNAVPDEYGKSRVCSLYYDTPDNRLIRASLDKPIYKEKLRLRSYGVPTADKPCFLELKKKYKGVVFKRRISAPYADITGYMAGENGKIENSQILKEIDYFKRFYGELKPAANIFYDREAFYDRTNREVRLTFDSNILARGWDLDLEKGIYGERVLENGLYILEVKTAGAMPMWVAEMLNEFKIHPTSFSKYGTAYKNGLLTRENKKIITLGGEYCA